MLLSLPNARYERKFLATGMSVAEALALVRAHRAAFRQIYPARTVNSLYLDSPSLGDYSTHVNGASIRSKTRVRWYGDGDSLCNGFILERKFKSGAVSGKTGHALACGADATSDVVGRLTACLTSTNLPEAFRIAVRDRMPIVISRYRRHYLVSRDSRFRVTVDNDLRFDNVWTGCATSLGGGCLPGVTVIELKYVPGEAAEADRITGGLPFRLGRFSKYVRGVEMIRGV